MINEHDGYIQTEEPEAEESNFVKHARRELTLIGEEPEVIEWYCRVVGEYASFGHSGGSHWACLPILYHLLQFKELSPLTNDPDEWVDQSSVSSAPLWQNKRNSAAMSHDGGKTYYLVSDTGRDGKSKRTHISVNKER